MKNRNRLVRITEASEYLGLSPTTVRRWVREGLCPVLKSPGGRWFWNYSLLEEIKNNMLDEGGNHAAKSNTPGTPNSVCF
jgi:excisionase family DNA binding protein